jgi:hypothetical protein
VLVSVRKKLEALKAGRELPVDVYALAHGRVGDVPDTDERAVLELACAIHHAESDRVAVSWEAQERAAQYFNTHGLSKTLDEMFRLEAAPKCGGKGCRYCVVGFGQDTSEASRS